MSDKLNLSPNVKVVPYDGADKDTRDWGFRLNANTGDVTIFIPMHAYETERQNAREWSVLAGVLEQLPMLFDLVTGANASPAKREDN